jgi:CBS domain-containing protein
MDTRVSHLCRPVVTVELNTPVTEILSNTSWDKLSSVVVLNSDKKVVGIITENDLLYSKASGPHMKELKAADICSRNIIKISPEDSIVGAARLMVEKNVHHVLIMVGDYVEGIVSTLDVLKQYLDSK